jgi:CubicO group peptidase (beta-lactamase class C family)
MVLETCFRKNDMRTVPRHQLPLLLVPALFLGVLLAWTRPALCIFVPYALEPSPALAPAPFALELGSRKQAWTASLPSPALPGTIALLLQRATERHLIYGGVVLVGNQSGTLSVTARGRIDNSRGALPLDERTIFDLASLTKVVATAPAIMKLLDQGRISLSDPLSRWFPEFRNRRHSITVQELLTHTSGLTDRRLLPHQTIHGVALRAARHQELYLPGRHFLYADINFILLGELVHRASGRSLDVFSREEIYAPLGMVSTMFLPPRGLSRELAPSTDFAKGKPQDRDARRLGGVAGHAGLFSSASDLSRYARLMLGHGMLEGKRVLSEASIAQMTAAHPCGGGAIERGLGWDIDSPFSAPKGTLFSGKSFGHTGYSGSSLWIDPESDLYVIVLTNRRDFKDTTSFNQFRRDVSTLAAAQFGGGWAGSSFASLQRAQDEVSRVTARCFLPASVRPRSLVRSPVRSGPGRSQAASASGHRLRKSAAASHGRQRKGQRTRHRA